MRLRTLFVFLIVCYWNLALGHKEIHSDHFFVPNHGQFHDDVRFKHTIQAGALFVTDNALVYHLYDAAKRSEWHVNGNFPKDSSALVDAHAFAMRWLGTQTPKTKATGKLAPHHNYFLGNDESKWKGNVPLFEKAILGDLYPGVDVHFYVKDDLFKYDFIVAPNADVNSIQWKYDGIDKPRIKGKTIQLKTALGKIVEYEPYAFQVIDGDTISVPCFYQEENGVFSFQFPKGFDNSVELVIDPTLIFSSFSGSTANNFGYSATFDALGFLYSGSTAFGLGYPTTLGAYQINFAGGTGSGVGIDMAISKWDTTGTSLIYSTYLGGSSDELPHSLIVNDQLELLVMGTTSSLNYPTVANSYDTSFNLGSTVTPIVLGGLGINYVNGSDIIVTKFNASGSDILGSTYLGGTGNDGLNLGATSFNYADEVRGEVLIDNAGDIYVVSATRSTDNPMPSPSFQTTAVSSNGTSDGIIYKLNNNLTDLQWSAYLGGTENDAIYSVALNQQQNIIVSGGTNSGSFPTTPQAFDVVYNGAIDGFVTEIAADGSQIIASTYYGSSAYDQSYFVEVDNNDFVYLFGQTSAPTNNLISNATYNDPNGGQFVVKFHSELDSITWSTRFGSGDGDPDISPTAFLVDLCNAIYISGWGSGAGGGSLSTTGLDTAGGPIQGTTDGHDFYLAVIADDASQLTYGTFFGGSAQEHVDGGTSRFDRKGKIYQAVCAGCGGTSDFPTLPDPGAVSNTNDAGTGCNLAVFKIDFLLPIVVADFLTDAQGCAPYNASFNNLSLTQSATTFLWDFGDGTTSTATNPSHLYTQGGTYNVTLVVSDNNTCNLSDTLTKTITVLSDTSYSLPNDTVCWMDPTVIGFAPGQVPPGTSIQWIPTTFLNNPSIANPTITTPSNQNYTILLDNGTCVDTVFSRVIVDSVIVEAPADTVICSIDFPITLVGNTDGTAIEFVWSTNGNFTDTLNTSPTDSTFTITSSSTPVNTFHFMGINERGCAQTDLMNLIVEDFANPLTAQFDAPDSVCALDSFNLINTTINGTNQTNYSWNFGDGGISADTNPRYAYNNPGLYTITLIAADSSNCPQADTTLFTIYVDADSVFVVDHLACYGQETQIGVDPNNFTSSTLFTWLPGTPVNDLSSPNPIGIFTNDTTVILIAEGVCTDSIFDQIDVEPIFAETPEDRVLCSDELPYTIVGNSFGSGDLYVWSTSSDFSDTLKASTTDSTLTIDPDTSIITYYFSVTSPRGCIETDSSRFIISDRTLRVEPQYEICFNDTLLILTENLDPINNPLSYNWSPLDGLLSPPDSAHALVFPDESTFYRLYTVNDSGCARIDTVFITKSTLDPATVTAEANPDTIVRSFSTELTGTPQVPQYSYRWAPADPVDLPTSPETSASPVNTTTFTYSASDTAVEQCVYRSSVSVVVKDLICGPPDVFIPNAFSPDGDGLNDEILVRGVNVKDMTLSIYNRWGDLVFETSNQNNGWDGTHNGKEADPAVYVYYLNITCVDGQRYEGEGNITLLR
jgi:gliding motility-associated-like protein